MRPNILLVHCHDIGAYMGPYPDNAAVTPNVDALASGGVVLENHFAAAPTCSPSRASMVTGLVPHRHGLMGLQNHALWNMDPAIPTIASLLRAEGYQTACFGTWHVNNRPYASGFDIFDPETECERVAANVGQFIGTRDSAVPFFAMAGFFEPHRDFTDRWPDRPDPDEVPVPYFLPDIPEARQEMSNFYGDVARADWSLGQILVALERAGQSENTLVVFTADHGIAMPLAKGTLSDRGCHIGAVLSWPGQLPAESRYQGLTSNVDLLPTFLQAAGCPNRVPAAIDGVSFLDAICGGAPARDHVFAESTWHDFYEPMRSVRTLNHKLIRNFEVRPGLQLAGDIRQSPIVPHMRWQLRSLPRPEYELYDLATDPREQQNLAGDRDRADRFAELTALLDEHLRETADPILNGPVEPPPSYWPFLARSPAGLP